MRRQVRWRNTIPTIGVALMLGLALTAFTSSGAVLGNKSDGPVAVADTEVAVDAQDGSIIATDVNDDADDVQNEDEDAAD